MAAIKVGGRSLDEWHEQLRIDTDALDQEIEMHPYLFYQVASAQTQAISQRDEYWDRVKQRDAELNFEVRDQLANEGQRVTEELVKSAVQKHPDHINIYNEYLKKKYVADQLDALKSAFQQRGYMLRDLAQLYMTGYHANTSVGGASPYTRERAQEDHNRARLREGLGRRSSRSQEKEEES